MSRTLGLLRHAKSAYPDGVVDHLRPLSERGERDATAAGPVVRDRLGPLQLVLVSTATRAQQTWSLVAAAWDRPPRHDDEDKIYEAYTDDLLLLIRGVESSVNSLLLVGHNPGFEDLAFGLVGDGSDSGSLEAMSAKYPTCALAVFEIESEWEHLVHGSARLTSFDVPRG
jgi:phosphohistidine phosphatase